MSVEKATLTPIDVTTPNPTPIDAQKVVVQFNPTSLRVTHSTSGGASSQSTTGNAGPQDKSLQPTSYSGSLAVDLLFDTSESGEDVRKNTLKIAAMIAKQAPTDAPLVQFLWGNFLFNGNIQSMTETLDFFSDRGIPLRATVNLTLEGQGLEKNDPRRGGTAGTGGGAGAGLSAGAGAGFSASAEFSAGASASLSASVGVGAGIGTTPLTLTQAGDTLQSLTARAGAGASWKAIAAANNIDNPRQLDPGEVLDLNARASVSIK